MKIVYLIGSILMTVVLLIFAFENIQGSCVFLKFFFIDVSSQNLNPTFLFLFTSFLGIITGLFYGALFHSFMKGTEDEDDEGI